MRSRRRRQGSRSRPIMARRVEILIRAKTQVPPEYEIHVGPRQKSEVPGFDAIEVTFSANGKTSKPLAFLLSDGREDAGAVQQV